MLESLERESNYIHSYLLHQLCPTERGRGDVLRAAGPRLFGRGRRVGEVGALAFGRYRPNGYLAE